jgi:hypothetical protein
MANGSSEHAFVFLDDYDESDSPSEVGLSTCFVGPAWFRADDG